jgi:quinol monooxygenase YgiN
MRVSFYQPFEEARLGKFAAQTTCSPTELWQSKAGAQAHRTLCTPSSYFKQLQKWCAETTEVRSCA